MYAGNLKQPFIITFSFIAISMVGLYIYHYLYIDNIHSNIKQTIHSQELLWKANDLQYYDEVLTNSAENYILTSNLSWLDSYEAAYKNFTEHYESVNHLQLDGDVRDIFNSNDSITAFIHSIEVSAIKLMKAGEEEKALEQFKSAHYWQAKDTFHQRIKDYKTHYSDGQVGNDTRIETVFRAFERLNLIFLLFFVVIAILLLVLARYVAKAFARLRLAGSEAIKRNIKISKVKNELEDKNEEYRVINNELLEQSEALRITDETLKDRNDALLAAEEELRSNLEELYQKNSEIEKSEERFKYLSSLASEGIIIHNKGLIIDVNESICALLGYGKEHFIERHIIEVLGEVSTKELFVEHLSMNEPVLFETTIKKANGETIPISVNSKDTVYKAKKVSVTAIRDISERINAELLLKESEERLRLAMKGTNDGLWDWNLISDEIYYSLNWKTMLGYQDHELVNEIETWRNLLHPEDLEMANAQIDRLIRGEDNIYHLEFRMQHKSGHYLHILSRGYMMRNAEGEIARIIGTHQDLSQRYAAEQRLRDQVDENLSLYEEYRTISEELHHKNDELLTIEDELRTNNKELNDKNDLLADSEERFKSLFEKSKSVMMIIDSYTGKILEANKSACEYYGYSHTEITAREIFDINTLPDDEIKKELLLARTEKRPHYTFQHKLKSGEVRDVDVYTSVINYNNKHDLYSIVIDRTETVKANKAIAMVNRRLRGLESIVHYRAKSINDLLDFTLKEIIEYTSSELGLFYHYEKNKGLFLLNNWSESALLTYESEKASHFDNLDCLNKAVSEKRTIIINDNQTEYPFILSPTDNKMRYKSVTIPVIVNNEVEAVVWIGSKTADYALSDMQQVSFLLDTTWILVERQKMQDLLKSKLHLT